MDIVRTLDHPRHWWKIFAAICLASFVVVGYVGYQTYAFAPPQVDFVDDAGATVVSGEAVRRGQRAFLRRGLMSVGTFLGDGGLRGPDFTAEALRVFAASLARQHDAAQHERFADAVVRARVVDAIVAAADVVAYYRDRFGAQTGVTAGRALLPRHYLSDDDARDVAAFFLWGAWLCAAERPGHSYSYTHNWPYDPAAGNVPHGGLLLWSAIGVLVVLLSIGVMFYVYGRSDVAGAWSAQQRALPPLATDDVLARFVPTPTQRALYAYFAVAAVVFLVQVSAGLLAISDFLGLNDAFASALPLTVTRSWHAQLSLLWIATCWFGASIWVLPQICRPQPRGQLALVRALLALLVIIVLGTLVGIPAGLLGALQDHDAIRWLGIQGWEFMELGRLWHVLLYLAFALWGAIVLRGLWPMLRRRQTWSLPNWLAYTIVGVLLMFLASFVATPDTSFVIADFWRWCTIHMWVEAFFELLTTILVAYFLYLMGLVGHAAAARVVYLAAVLFLGSGLVGISHNFYWNAKSIETVALGGVLSSLQVAPLILLTVEAYRFRHLPTQVGGSGRGAFGLAEPFAFLVAVNFWNFVGAGLLGFLINLPIVNYYQHGTYLTVNHGHAALMGVYGNLAIAAMLFCARWNLPAERWRPRLLRTILVAINVGLGLMVGLDLFPVGLHQLAAVVEHGYAYARSEAYVASATFQTLTWLRGVGVAVFVLGGVLPLCAFMVANIGRQKAAHASDDAYAVPATVLATQRSAD